MNKEIKILVTVVFLIIIGWVIGSSYYRNSVQRTPVAVNGNSNNSAASNETLIRPDSATLGAPDASVTVVEFLDPECESCAAFAPIVKKLLNDYNGKVRLVVRYMPLHPNSFQAAALNEAAGEQGKYWEMQNLLFQKQPEWGTKHGPPSATPPPDINVLFDKYAKELNLDMEKVNSALRENRFRAKIDRDLRDGQSLGVRQTPTFFVNGRKLARFGEPYLKALIEEELKK